MDRPNPDLHPDQTLEAEGEVPVRLMDEKDLPALVSIDRKTSGHDRTEYLTEKFSACVREPGLNTSLVAEVDGHPVGFLMGRLFFGEFGLPSARAVLDTLGVHPNFQRRHVGMALLNQYQRNMMALRVEAIDTLVDWDRFGLISFFREAGFQPSRDVDLEWDLKKYPFQGRDTGVRFRQAWEADLERVTQIDAAAVQTARTAYFTAKHAAASSRPERNLFLVADLDGEVAGFLVARLFTGEFGIDETRGVIEAFAVAEPFGHRGIASGMVQHLQGWLEEKNIQRMETLVRWNNWDLLRFFEYIGYRPSSRINLEWRF